MRKNGFITASCLLVFITQFSALTVELIDEYAPSPGPVLAAASESVPTASPTGSQADLQGADPQIVPATFTVPQPSPEQAPRTQPSVNFNYRYTPGG